VLYRSQGPRTPEDRSSSSPPRVWWIVEELKVCLGRTEVDDVSVTRGGVHHHLDGDVLILSTGIPAGTPEHDDPAPTVFDGLYLFEEDETFLRLDLERGRVPASLESSLEVLDDRLV